MVSTRQSSSMGSASGGGPANEVADQVGTSRRHQPVVPVAGTSSAPAEPATTSNLNLLDLPVEVLEKIFSYLDYNTIAHLRPVCHQMDRFCGSILNSTFQKLQAQMLSRFQAIKAQMPRRESARRFHPLACESNVIETLHMRLTLLQMTFGKHIERKHCCFFPGGVLDEVYRILHYIKVTPKLVRPFKLTDELFDLSTMAMEYFRECIEPRLPEIPYFGADFLDLAGTFSSSSNVSKPFMCLDSAPVSVGGSRTGTGSGEEGSPPHSPDDPGLLESSVSPPQSNMVLRKRIRKIKQGMKRYNSQLTLMRRDLRNCKAKIAEQQKQIVEYATRLDDNDKKNEETSRKFSTLLQELNKCKTELQYWRSKSPAIPVCIGCGQSMPVPTEEALTGQGGLSKPFGEGLDFIPIADGNHSPTELAATQQQSQLQLQLQLQLQSQLPPQAQSQVQSQPQTQSPQSQAQQQQQVLQQQQQQQVTQQQSQLQLELTTAQQQPQSQTQLQLQLQSQSQSQAAPGSSPSVGSQMAPPKGPPVPSLSSKRKSAADETASSDVAKKPRRTAKSRQAKRSKM